MIQFDKMDKQAFSVVSLHDPSDDLAYWLTKTPEERILACEFLRQMAYGYDPLTARVERVLTVTELGKD